MVMFAIASKNSGLSSLNFVDLSLTAFVSCLAVPVTDGTSPVSLTHLSSALCNSSPNSSSIFAPLTCPQKSASGVSWSSSSFCARHSPAAPWAVFCACLKSFSVYTSASFGITIAPLSCAPTINSTPPRRDFSWRRWNCIGLS